MIQPVPKKAICAMLLLLRPSSGRRGSSSTFPLIVTNEVRLLHTLSCPSRLVVHATIMVCASSSFAYAASGISESIRVGFTSTRCLSMMSRCGTCAGGSIPEFPNWIVGGTRALGRINRQVVPPFAGMLTLSQTRI